jgi:hypothetical protein
MNSTNPWQLRLILLAGGEFGAVWSRALTGRKLDHTPQTLKREAAGDRRHPPHRRIVGSRHACRRRCGQGKPFPFGMIGHRHVDRSHRDARHEPGMNLGEVLGDKHNRHVHPPEQRVGGPAQDPHEPGRRRPRPRLTSRHEVRRVVEHHGDPLPLVGRVDEISLEQRVERGNRRVGIPWPG